MRVSLVSVEDGIVAIGFRKVAAAVRAWDPASEVCYVPPFGTRSFFRLLFRPPDITSYLDPTDLAAIEGHLGRADVACFSSMTPFAAPTKSIIAALRSASPRTFVIWGGVHPTIDPDDAILHADAICTGEGEIALPLLLQALADGRDHTTSKNFWFRGSNGVVKNDPLPLHDARTMEALPHPLYADNELIYSHGDGFVPMELKHYLAHNDLTYSTLWSLGCPYHCTYCSNSKFLEIDEGHGKIRHPGVSHIIDEVRSVLARHPHISLVRFHDDSFMAVRLQTLVEFATTWKEKVGLPFWVYGLNPNVVDEEKLAVLIDAGMSRVRMGVQSGSDRILAFYRRPNRPGLVPKAMRVLNGFSGAMDPPFYDIIVDNPVETPQDVVDTLELLYHAPRPYRLFIYALRTIPNTEMARTFADLGISGTRVDAGFRGVLPNPANAMVYMLAVCKPPEWLYAWFLEKIRDERQRSRRFIPFYLLRTLYKFRMAVDLITSCDFTVFPGRFGWLLWRLGLVGLLRRKPPGNGPAHQAGEGGADA